jgi:hypothetical protein
MTVSEITPTNIHLADFERIKVRLIVICSDATKQEGINSFLSRRGWEVLVTDRIGEALTTLSDTKVDFVMLSVNHPNPKIKILPSIINHSYQVPCVLFGEHTDAKTLNLLQSISSNYKMMGMVSGPMVQRRLKQILKELFKSPDIQEVTVPEGESFVWKMVASDSNTAPLDDPATKVLAGVGVELLRRALSLDKYEKPTENISEAGPSFTFGSSDEPKKKKKKKKSWAERLSTSTDEPERETKVRGPNWESLENMQADTREIKYNLSQADQILHDGNIPKELLEKLENSFDKEELEKIKSALKKNQPWDENLSESESVKPNESSEAPAKGIIRAVNSDDPIESLREVTVPITKKSFFGSITQFNDVTKKVKGWMSGWLSGGSNEESDAAAEETSIASSAVTLPKGDILLGQARVEAGGHSFEQEAHEKINSRVDQASNSLERKIVQPGEDEESLELIKAFAESVRKRKEEEEKKKKEFDWSAKEKAKPQDGADLIKILKKVVTQVSVLDPPNPKNTKTVTRIGGVAVRRGSACGMVLFAAETDDNMTPLFRRLCASLWELANAKGTLLEVGMEVIREYHFDDFFTFNLTDPNFSYFETSSSGRIGIHYIEDASAMSVAQCQGWKEHLQVSPEDVGSSAEVQFDVFTHLSKNNKTVRLLAPGNKFSKEQVDRFKQLNALVLIEADSRKSFELHAFGNKICDAVTAKRENSIKKAG